MQEDLVKASLAVEKWREYDFQGRVYRINDPKELYYRKGGTTHRILTYDGIVHLVPAPGQLGCVLRWENKDPDNPVNF